MGNVIHRAEDRGKGDHGWLTTRYSFSFADWYDPSRIGFGALRVINDDSIAPLSGFGAHSHRDMEIITIVTQGTVTHKDSMGNEGTVKAGEVQIMSAGTGVVHSEYNNEDEPLALFQIWIEPKAYGVPPRYEQKAFDFMHMQIGSTQLVGKDGLLINQDAGITYAAVDKDHPLSYEITQGNGIYVFIIEGSAFIEGERLQEKDAIGITKKDMVMLAADAQAKMLVIEVPVSDTLAI